MPFVVQINLPGLVMGQKEGVGGRERKCEKQKMTEIRLQRDRKSKGRKKSRGQERCRLGGRGAAGRAKTKGEKKDGEAERWTPDGPEEAEGGARPEMWASKPGQVPPSRQASLIQPGPKGPVLYQSCPSMAR